MKLYTPFILIVLFVFQSYSQNVIFNDDFTKDNYNLTLDDNDFKIYFEQKALFLKNNDKKSSKWQLLSVNKNLEIVDFDVEATIALVESNSDSSGYGLVWGCSSDYANFHVVNLNGSRQNQVYWYNNKNYNYDLAWEGNNTINSKGKNTIKVSKRAQNVTIFINGKLVVKTNNSINYGDNFGFILDPKTTIKVTNLTITEFPLSIAIEPGFDPTLKIEKLPSYISSSTSDEKNPVISSNGKTLYFVRGGSSSNGNKLDKNKVWTSDFINNKWTTPKIMGRPINNDTHNFVISVSPDNNSLLVNGLYDREGISISNKTQKGWAIPKEVKIKNYVNKSKYVGFFLANDNKHLLMSVERKNSFGKLDLYISFLEKDGEWSVPVNLGDVINTDESEGNPFLASDGKTLYFFSDGHAGYGGLDLFVSKRLDDSWTNWSKPKNLGNVINSSYNDFSIFLAAKGDKAYLSRDKDIYEITNKVNQDPVILVQGKVYDSKTGKIISAPILYNDLTSDEELGTAISDPNTGSYSIVLPFGEKYSFMAEKEGYYAVTQNVDLSNLIEYKEITVDLYLNPIEKGQTIRLNNIFFESGKYDLLKESNAELGKLYKVLMDNPKLTIEIAGHTDAVGADKDNLLLSTNRANAVMNYLLTKGIKQERLRIKGYGETIFIATNETEEGKQQNRRVEFSILEM